MGYQQEPGMTGEISAGGQYDNVDVTDSVKYPNLAASNAAEAAISAAAALVSETNAAASETNAATSEANAATSETNAATSATNAATSAAAALVSENNASTSESNAATSETNAAASESAAATSETNAANSASAAATSAANALTSETNAATSESNAATSATNASNSASAAATSATNASNSASAAATSETNAATSETNAATSETNAAASESAAATSETNAANSASAAATSASNALTSANNAATSASSAASSLAGVEALYDAFDDRYLGSKSTAPTLDNDGNALTDGALYFDTTVNLLHVYDLGNTTWLDIPNLTLASLIDVLLTSPTTGDVLKYNGSKWINTTQVALSQLTITGGTGTQGQMTWNTEDETVDLIVSPDVTYQLGQEMGLVVRNLSGATLNNGAVVRVTGASGNKVTVDVANAGSELGSASTFAIVTETISNNSTGRITTHGLVRGLDTSSFTEGVALWLSNTNGQFTATKPLSPNHLVHLGWVVRSHSTEGIIFVHVNNGWELEELHDVLITSVANNDVLKYNSTTNVWENVQLPSTAITSTQITNWDTAYSWGDHSTEGYLTSYTETDPIYTASSWHTTTNNANNWDTAYSWGDHSIVGYLTSYTETDPIYTASSWHTTTNNSSNWDTAYGWGNHASVGYLTSYTETDPVFTASAAANITSTHITNLNSLGTAAYNNTEDFDAAGTAVALAIALG